jgi:SAM-dependent MidA family methyltransferase
MPWAEAMQRALVGPTGFYRGAAVPAAHFRTAVTAAPELAAQAISVLLDDVQASLGGETSDGVDLVDLGAGGGELLGALARRLPDHVLLHGVEVAARPAGLPDRVTWSPRLPSRVAGLLIAHEYLDNVPVDIVEVDGAGVLRVVLVDPATGDERLGAVVGPAERDWLARWWPLAGQPPGSRAEVGLARDAAWAAAVASVHRGMAIAIDYDHGLDDRPPRGTLTGYRRGREVTPVPDGSCDVTAHVALDACAAAGITSGADETVLLRQAAVLRALGVRAGRPPVAIASSAPVDYLRALAAAGSAAELLDRTGLGAFGWLVQSVGVPMPERLLRTS